MKNFIRNNALFLHKSLNGLADSLIKIFIPIIVLKITGNIYFVLLFMILRPVFFVIFNILFQKFLRKYPTLSICIHIIPIIAIQFIIFFVTINIYYIIFLAILMALFNVFYSIPINLLFVFSDKKLNVSKMESGTNVGRILFILISGFIINNGTFIYLLLLLVFSSIIYILSTLPLIWGDQKIKEYNKTFKNEQENKNLILDKKDKYLFNIIHTAFGCFQILIDEVLPVYLYVAGLNFVNIAVFQVLIEAGKLLSNVLASWLNKIKKSNITLIISCVVYIFSIVTILLVHNVIFIYILSALIGVTYPLIFIPIFKRYCEEIKDKPYLMDQIAIRDNYVFGGRPFLISSYFIGFSFIAPFSLAVLSSVTLAVLGWKLLKK